MQTLRQLDRGWALQLINRLSSMAHHSLLYLSCSHHFVSCSETSLPGDVSGYSISMDYVHYDPLSGFAYGLYGALDWFSSPP